MDNRSDSMSKKLVDILKSAGKHVEVYRTPDGTEVLAMPYGGRVLAVFAPGSDENFYWTNTALESAESAKEYFNDGQFHHTGGDRTWLSPEIDFFFPKYPDMTVYDQPRTLDPGNFQVVKNESDFQLVNEFTVHSNRSNNDIKLKMTKSLGPALNPLRYEKDADDLTDMDYAGYALFGSLQVMNPNNVGKDLVGLWNLVQMPHGGDLIVPTYCKTEPKIYFGDITSDDLIVSDNLIRYRMRAKGEHKLGIRAVATTGRVGYIYKSGDNWALIIRNFICNPSGEYVDVPWQEQEYLGYSTQACNVNSGLGQFSELEYHIPAIGPSIGRIKCDDAAQVWAYRGPQEKVKRVAQILLSTNA